MKNPLVLIIAFTCILLFSFCNKKEAMSGPESSSKESSKIKISIGKHEFITTLQENKTARAFKNALPLTIQMKELSGNEKYADLAQALPADAVYPGKIKSGDLMLYGSNTLVVFYKSFKSSYPYTPVGFVDHPEELAAALGSGDVTITFKIN